MSQTPLNGKSDLPANVLSLFKSIEEFDFTEIQDQLIRNENFSKARADEAELEAKKLLAVSLLSTEDLAILNGDPDIFWHYLVLNTKTYREFCKSALNETFIDHVPITPDVTVVKEPYEHTLKKMKKYFNDTNPIHWLPDPESMPMRWCAWCMSKLERKFPLDKNNTLVR